MKKYVLYPIAGLVLSLLLIVALNPSVAHATQDYGDVTGWAQVTYPAWDNDSTPNVVDIQVQNKPRAWGLRSFAESIDRKVGGIRIHYGAGPSCKAHPHRYCITVKAWYYPRSPYWGLTSYHRDGATIRLNRKYGVSKWPAAHEFMHALGEQHHMYGHGLLLLPTPSMQWLSKSELQALRWQYGR